MRFSDLELFFIKVLLSLMLTVAGIAEAEEIEPIIHGKVLEKGTRKPLEGIIVYLAEQETISTTSTTSGGFKLTVNGPGNYLVSATGMGYVKPKPLEVAVGAPGKPAHVVFYLEPV